jgi:hypothetical protein
MKRMPVAAHQVVGSRRWLVINSSIRVRPRDLEEFVAAKVTIAGTRRPHRRKESV